jgi:hypothetical protein
VGVGGQRHAPVALPPGMTRYPLYRRLGRPQGRSGRVLKISPPPEFDARTVQLVASRYTDWAIPVPIYLFIYYLSMLFLSSRLSLGISNGLIPSGFTIKTSNYYSSIYTPHYMLLIFRHKNVWDGLGTLRKFLQPPSYMHIWRLNTLLLTTLNLCYSLNAKASPEFINM